jgi:integral membrane protein (TIGR01906 family)
VKQLFYSVLSYFITIIIPFVLLGLALRILLTPLFLQVEYRMPYFPPDDYGFTTADRLHWAPYAMNYLTNSADISYLGNLRFPDGSPLFNERELSHMHDVKNVTQGALKTWYVSLGLLLILGIWAWRSHWLDIYLAGARRGGWLMVGLAVALGLLVGFGSLGSGDVFWQFFTDFHHLFFKGDSWLFLFSDTLIRLFPLQFWQDAFLFAAILSLAGGLALGFGLKPKKG